MTLHVIFQANKRKQIQESNKIIFPTRDVLSFSFGINSNNTYLTKCINSNILNTSCFEITIYFSYFLKFVCNVLKITLWPVFKHPDVLQNQNRVSRN